MGKKRTYSDEEKANALAAMDANGGDVFNTARQMGIPYQTLQEWSKGRVHPAVLNIRQGKRADMAAALGDVAWQLLEAIPGKIDPASLTQTATAMGIAIDKQQLLLGRPTAIHQHDVTRLSDNDLDREIAECQGEVGRLACREGAPAGEPS